MQGNTRGRDPATGNLDEPEDTTHTHAINLWDAVAVAVFSTVGMASLFGFRLGVGDVFPPDISLVVNSIVLPFLLLALPAAYIAVISTDRFRWESLGALVAVPFAVQGTLFAAVGAGLVLGSLFVSYGASRRKPSMLALFKATGGLIFVLALVLGVAAAHTYNNDPAFRSGLQGNVTEQTVDTAVQFATVGQDGDSSGQNGLSAGQLTTMAEELAENVSHGSITATEEIVEQGMEQSGEFDQREERIITQSFDYAADTVPSEVRDRAGEQVQEQLAGATAAQDIEEDVMKSTVRPRVRGLIEELGAPTPQTTAIMFLATFSMIMLFKIPFGLIAMVYAAVLGRTRSFILSKRR